MLLTEELLDMDYSLNRAGNPKWKKEMLADLKKKYKISNMEKENSS